MDKNLDELKVTSTDLREISVAETEEVAGGCFWHDLVESVRNAWPERARQIRTGNYGGGISRT